MVNIIRSKVVDSTNDLKEQNHVYGQYYKVEGGTFDKWFKKTKSCLWSILRVYDDHHWKITQFNVVKENDKICHHRRTNINGNIHCSTSASFIQFKLHRWMKKCNRLRRSLWGVVGDWLTNRTWQQNFMDNISGGVCCQSKAKNHFFLRTK